MQRDEFGTSDPVRQSIGMNVPNFSNMNYVTFELKLSTAECVVTYLIQLNAKCF